MVIVEAGARRDLGQDAESLRILRAAIESATGGGEAARQSKARLRYAYADTLAAQGKDQEARSWFVSAAKLDELEETDAQARVDALDGLTIDFDDTDEADEADGDDQIGEGAVHDTGSAHEERQQR